MEEGVIRKLLVTISQLQNEAAISLQNDNEDPCFDDSNTLAIQLCIHINEILSHGLKGKYAHGKEGYAAFVLYFCRKDVVQEIKGLKSVRTGWGRGRAFIRHALNEQALEAYFHTFQSNPKLIAKFYDSASYLLRSDDVDSICTILSGLETLQFNLPLDVPTLDPIKGPGGVIRQEKNKPVTTSVAATSTTLRSSSSTTIQASTTVTAKPSSSPSSARAVSMENPQGQLKHGSLMTGVEAASQDPLQEAIPTDSSAPRQVKHLAHGGVVEVIQTMKKKKKPKKRKKSAKGNKEEASLLEMESTPTASIENPHKQATSVQRTSTPELKLTATLNSPYCGKRLSSVGDDEKDSQRVVPEKDLHVPETTEGTGEVDEECASPPLPDAIQPPTQQIPAEHTLKHNTKHNSSPLHIASTGVSGSNSSCNDSSEDASDHSDDGREFQAQEIFSFGHNVSRQATTQGPAATKELAHSTHSTHSDEQALTQPKEQTPKQEKASEAQVPVVGQGAAVSQNTRAAAHTMTAETTSIEKQHPVLSNELKAHQSQDQQQVQEQKKEQKLIKKEPKKEVSGKEEGERRLKGDGNDASERIDDHHAKGTGVEAGHLVDNRKLRIDGTQGRGNHPKEQHSLLGQEGGVISEVKAVEISQQPGHRVPAEKLDTLSPPLPTVSKGDSTADARQEGSEGRSATSTNILGTASNPEKVSPAPPLSSQQVEVASQQSVSTAVTRHDATGAEQAPDKEDDRMPKAAVKAKTGTRGSNAAGGRDDALKMKVEAEEEEANNDALPGEEDENVDEMEEQEGNEEEQEDEDEDEEEEEDGSGAIDPQFQPHMEGCEGAMNIGTANELYMLAMVNALHDSEEEIQHMWYVGMLDGYLQMSAVLIATQFMLHVAAKSFGTFTSILRIEKTALIGAYLMFGGQGIAIQYKVGKSKQMQLLQLGTGDPDVTEEIARVLQREFPLVVRSRDNLRYCGVQALLDEKELHAKVGFYCFAYAALPIRQMNVLTAGEHALNRRVRFLDVGFLSKSWKDVDLVMKNSVLKCGAAVLQTHKHGFECFLVDADGAANPFACKLPDQEAVVMDVSSAFERHCISCTVMSTLEQHIGTGQIEPPPTLRGQEWYFLSVLVADTTILICRENHTSNKFKLLASFEVDSIDSVVLCEDGCVLEILLDDEDKEGSSSRSKYSSHASRSNMGTSTGRHDAKALKFDFGTMRLFFPTRNAALCFYEHIAAIYHESMQVALDISEV